MNNKFFRLRYAMTMLFMLCLMILNFGCVFANEDSDDAFSGMISSFAEKGLIPGTIGNYYSFGAYEDSLAKMGYSSMIPLMEAEHFVISGQLKWISSSVTANSSASGCGFFFGASDVTGDHLMVSLRGDGYLYFSGYRKYNSLSYGKIPFAMPSYSGSGDLCLIVDGDRVNIFVNGESFLRRSEISASGNVLGLSVLSGTFQDYGTRCNFENLHVFTWE